jgi:hypothetical protein
MTVLADTKDWTWVLERPCGECGFDTRSVHAELIPQLLRENATAWVGLVAAGDLPSLTLRPSDERWSRLEYACHVRDVFRRFDQRLDVMLAADDPSFANWDQDATAVSDRYNEQEGAVVAVEIVEAGNGLADRFQGLSGQQWDRMGTRSDGARFNVETLGRYLLHDVVHHLVDVGVRAPAEA